MFYMRENPQNLKNAKFCLLIHRLKKCLNLLKKKALRL